MSMDEELLTLGGGVGGFLLVLDSHSPVFLLRSEPFGQRGNLVLWITGSNSEFIFIIGVETTEDLSDFLGVGTDILGGFISLFLLIFTISYTLHPVSILN